MKMKKVKDFCKKHKTAIAFLAGAAGAVCVGKGVGALKTSMNKSKFYPVNGPVVLGVLDDYLSKAKGDSTVFSAAHGSGLKPSELGKMGDNMLELGCSENQTFTHFVAIGEKMK